MFIGQFRHMLDEKNRAIIPSKFRKLLKKGVIISLGHNFLSITDCHEFSELIADMVKKGEKVKAKLIAGTAEEAEFDASGRICIPQFLISELAILAEKKELVILGAGDHIEVWPLTYWQDFFNKKKSLLEEQ